MARRRNYTCSFCGKSRDKVQDLIAGPHGVYICNECVLLCNEILTDMHTAPAQRGDRARQTVRHRTTSWWRRLLPGRRQTASLPVQT